MNTFPGRRRPVRRTGSLLFWCALAGLALGQTGCLSYLSEWIHNGFKVGPNYAPPPVPLTHAWIDQGNPRVGVGEPNLAAWWDVFCDPVLTKLIHQAYAQNLTVRQAGIQIMQAQIQRHIALTELLPQANSFLLQYTRGEVSRNFGASPGVGATFGLNVQPSPVVSPLFTTSTPIAGLATPLTPAGTTTTGVNTLVNGLTGGGGGGIPEPGRRFFNNIGTSLNFAWEVDVWGIFRRNLEAADASLEQSVHDYDELVVQLLANVATQYVEIRTLQKRLELARHNVRLQRPLVARLRKQYEAGIAVSKPAYFQLKSNLDNTRALIPPLQIALRQANNQLCVLLGIPVRDLLPELGDGTVPDPKDPAKRAVRIPRPCDDRVVLSIPGDTLLARPDVRAAEQQLRIQSAQIGIAEGELFPHIGINGSIGLAANSVARLFDQNSWLGNIGPSLAWNIFNYGRLLSNVRFQDNQFRQFVLGYQQTILNANQDAENAIVAFLQSVDQARFLRSSANAAEEVTNYYYGQLARGYLPPSTTSLAFYNQLFTAVNFLVTQQDVAAQAEGNIGLNLILVYRALGGGWQISLNGANCRGPGPAGPGANVAQPPATEQAPAPAPADDTLPMPRQKPAEPAAVSGSGSVRRLPAGSVSDVAEPTP
jgi:NodT family efflux transporter outer membrane factor (OMF) lipoprotein